jgi:hypothetical protein
MHEDFGREIAGRVQSPILGRFCKMGLAFWPDLWYHGDMKMNIQKLIKATKQIDDPRHPTR